MMSDINNSNTNENIINPIVKKLQLFTLSTPGVDDVHIMLQ